MFPGVLSFIQLGLRQICGKGGFEALDQFIKGIFRTFRTAAGIRKADRQGQEDQQKDNPAPVGTGKVPAVDVLFAEGMDQQEDQTNNGNRI